MAASSLMTISEHRVCLHGKTLAYRHWQPVDQQSSATPVLALHGWLDNCASFDFLAPQLARRHIVAPDLAGHGLSDHRSADAAYNIWQDIDDMQQLACELSWRRFVLMGHSRGAYIAALFAATYPEKVAGLILLDGLLPEPVDPAMAPQQLAKAIADKQFYLNRKAKCYASVSDAIKSRLHGPIKLTRRAAEAIAERGLMSTEGGYCWRADQRLRGASEFKLTLEHCRAFVRAIDCDTLLLVAGNELPAHNKLLLPLNHKIRVCHIDGGHHLHMLENSCDVVAEQCRRFLEHADS